MTNIWNKPIKEGLALKVKPKIKKGLSQMIYLPNLNTPTYLSRPNYLPTNLTEEM